jgi:predicted nucleic acid-binding protein
MALVLDTSAVVKLFVPESGSDEVEGIIAGDRVRHISGLTEHEFLSAVYLRVRAGTLPATAGDLAIQSFQSRFLPEVTVAPLDQDAIGRSLSLMRRHGPSGLRVLDSIQLASCQGVPDATLVLADVVLSRFAVAEGVPVRLIA